LLFPSEGTHVIRATMSWMTTPAASWLWGFVVCRCAVCAVSDAACLLGLVLHISHAILPWVLQLLKSERWNSAVFEVVLCVVAGELHAELTDARTMAGRRARIVSNEPPDAGRVLACYW